MYGFHIGASFYAQAEGIASSIHSLVRRLNRDCHFIEFAGESERRLVLVAHRGADVPADEQAVGVSTGPP